MKTQTASKKKAVRKNTPIGRDTEINERAPRPLFRRTVAPGDAENLPINQLPRHMGANADGDDENTLDEALARRGAGDQASGPRDS